MKTQIRIAGLAAFSMLALGMAPAHATDTNKFVEKASMSDMFEIQSSQLAVQRSTNPDVKMFAQHMIDDHTAASAKMKAAVSTGGADASKVATALDKKHQRKMDKLTKDDAEDFDEDYIDIQQTAHRKAVNLFKDYSDDGDNAALKSFAAETLPTLQAHKDSIDALEDKMEDAK